MVIRWWVWRWDQRCGDHAGMGVSDAVVVMEVVVMPW